MTVEPYEGAIICFLIFGIPAGIWMLIVRLLIVPKRVKTEGVVVDVLARRGNNGRLFCPVIKFTDKYGYERTESNGWYTSRPRYTGEQLAIFYDPYKPARFSIAGPFGLYLGPMVLFGISLFAAFIPLSNYLE